jgi:hypothetical protein
MYTNIPTNTVEKTIYDILIEEGNPPTSIRKLVAITKVILEQNYFQHNNQTIDNNMEIVKMKQKKLHLNTLENFYIYKLFQQGIQFCNNCPILHNPIFKQIQNLPG